MSHGMACSLQGYYWCIRPPPLVSPRVGDRANGGYGGARMMGSGPRTHEGGISDREWRRMQRRQLRQAIWERRKQQVREAKAQHARFKSLVQRLRSLPYEQQQQEPSAMASSSTPAEAAAAAKEEEEGEDASVPLLIPFGTMAGSPSRRFFPPHAVFSTRPYRPSPLDLNDGDDGNDDAMAGPGPSGKP